MAKFNGRVSKFLLGDTVAFFVRAEDGGVFVDESTAAGNVTENDMTLLPAVPAPNDGYNFGAASKFSGIALNFYQAGAGVWTISWMYSKGAGDWGALGVATNIAGATQFKPGATGWALLEFTPPADWATDTIDGQLAYWIKGYVSAYTSIVTQPKGTQARILRDISQYVTEISGLPGERELVEATTLGDAGHEKEPSLENGRFRLSGFFDDAAGGADVVLGLVRTHTVTVPFDYAPKGLAIVTYPHYWGYCWIRDYNASSPIGGLVLFGADAEVDGVISRGDYTV